MSHTIANLEYHHFKYRLFRRPGDLHVHFFGTATLSFGDGIRTEPGDVFEIEMAEFGAPLRNRLAPAAAGFAYGGVASSITASWRRHSCIAVDWGTTNRRAWALGPDGEHLAERGRFRRPAGHPGSALRRIRWKPFLDDWLKPAPGIPDRDCRHGRQPHGLGRGAVCRGARAA